MDKIRVRLSFLQSTEEEKAQGIVRFKTDGNFITDLHQYGLLHRDKLGDQMAVITDWNWDFTEEARHFYFVILDKIVKVQSGWYDKRERDLLHKQIKKQCNITRTDGKLKSLKKSETEPFKRSELWAITRTAIDWLMEAGGSMAGLRGEYKLLEAESGE